MASSSMMRGPLWSSLLLGLATLLPLCARAQDENKPILVVFGDSLADTGNLAAITRLAGDTQPPPDYYYKGRLSDGRNLVDYMKNMTGWDSVNYAVGGTSACPLSDEVLSFNASLGIQVSMFLQKQVPWKDQGAREESMRLLNSYRPMVIVILASNNDFHLVYDSVLLTANKTGAPVDDVMQGLINNGTLDATTIASCYMGAVSQLLPSDEQMAVDLRRVRGMVIYGPGAVHQTPLAVNSDFIGFSNTTRAMIGGVVEDLNMLLESRISELQLPSGVQAEFINLTSLQQRYERGDFPEFASDPIADEPCLDMVVDPSAPREVIINGVCDNPSAYMFHDYVHPRTTVHEALATISMETIKAAASGPKSAPADERSGEAAITIETRVTGYSGDDLSTDESKREDLFNRLSSAVAQNLALMRPELMLVEDASELDLVEPTQRRALKQVAGPCVACVKNKIINTENTSSEDFVTIKTTVLLPDNTDQSTLENVVAEIQSEGTSIFMGSSEESNIGISTIQVGDDDTGGGGGDNPDDPDPDGDLDGALHPFASVTTCITSVLSAILLSAL